MRKFRFLPIYLFLMWQCLLASDKQKVILDTDLGGDIDDAFALALVIVSPEFDVLGIVMDHGNTPERAKIACRMLYETGREDIPVVVGRKTNDDHRRQFSWGKGFDKVKPIEQSAADFIIENLRKYPNEVILFTVGPIPNIMDVIKKDKEALKLAKHIYSMYGSFSMGYNNAVPSAEWNVRGVEEASKMFSASGARMTYAGLDITTAVLLDADRRLKLLMRQSPLTNALCALYSLWGAETPMLHDPTAVGMVLWPELFTTRKAHVKVIDGGFTVIDESKEPNCEIAVSLRTEQFLRRLMERLLSQNLMQQ